MNSSELPPADARQIVRRYVHDLNNVANCLQLELSLLEDDPADALPPGALSKLGRLVAQLESTIRSLAVRFAEPSASVVSAYDVFQSWRDRVDHSGSAAAVEWQPPAATPLINIDFNAILTVLREICLTAGPGDVVMPRVARLYETGDHIVFEVCDARQSESGPKLNGAPEITEWKRIVAASGGALHCARDGSSSRGVTTVSFPKAAASPADFRGP